ncbi:MAG: LacI family DNA-binding transcriptional regulator [Prevotella sp.]|nr:LacI family DNA-binding transcriptional regulator [Prevotella sp.]
MKKRVSQRDIARRLGVNVSTVSRALNGLPGVSSELRQEIERLAMQQDYQPNPFAMSLRYDTTRIIGIIVPDIAFNHYSQIVKHIEAEAKKNGYMCIVTDSGDKYSHEVECVNQLLSKHVEGIVLCLSQETNDFAHIERLKERHIPVVLFDRVADVGCSTVSVNDVESGRQATLHLIDSGKRRIAFLGGPNKLKQTADRKHGYLEALRERGMNIRKDLVKCGNVSFNSGLSRTLELLDLPERPDAIIADHGLLVIASLQAIYSKGLRIPEDVAVIGFMSDWVSDISVPRITFVKQNLKEIGSKTFKLLLDQINGEQNIKHITVNARLNIKESA